MSELSRLKKDIAASLFLAPCDIDELLKRDFLRNKSRYGVDILISILEKDGAIFYKGEILCIRKKWAKKNLEEYDLDFRTKKQKERTGWSEFKKIVVDKFGL